jgi:hypothetical protein
MCNWLSILIFKQCQIGFVIFLLFYRNCCNCCPQFFINVLYGDIFVSALLDSDVMVVCGIFYIVNFK